MNFNYNYGSASHTTPRMKHNALPPPSSTVVNKQGYSTMNAISQNAFCATWGGSRKRAITEDEYFNDDEEENCTKLAYIPAPGSPVHEDPQKLVSDSFEIDDEDDPLDAYMAGIEQQVKNELSGLTPKSKMPKVVRNDLEDEDDEESYYRYMEENPTAGLLPVDEDSPDIDYDEDGNPIAPEKKKFIDPLPSIDHMQITYGSFKKHFYMEHEEIAQLDKTQVYDIRKKLDITVSGQDAAKPVVSFAHFNFDEKLLKSIIRADYTTPTPIQSQGVPCALEGRDVLGIAQTGSGKTAAFLWPMLVHVADQRRVEAGEGPIALVLAPTRELAIQIYNEARKFARVYDLRVICAYGGGSKWEQSNALKEGADIVVATPGRIIDHVKGGATNLQRVTFLVLDEADRMFELGFEVQVRSVVNHVRPDRQTLLFSATFRRKIERLAKDALLDPVKISQGLTGQANEDITQHALLLPSQNAKRDWLHDHLVQMMSAGSVLIFVTRKADAEQVAVDLRLKEFDCVLMHGDMDQADRNKVITAFKRKESLIMVATDVAARGLDIPHIRTVINYDCARDIDTHTHRVGRTGRAGTHGTAYTLLTERDKEFAGHIVNNLEGARQDVPQCVLNLALQSSWYKKARYKKKDQAPNVGGLGFGFVEKVKPSGFHASSSSSPMLSDVSRPVLQRGPATDRLAAMKAAFKSQYQSQFMLSANSVRQTATVSANSSSRERKRSRWQ